MILENFQILHLSFYFLYGKQNVQLDSKYVYVALQHFARDTA